MAKECDDCGTKTQCTWCRGKGHFSGVLGIGGRDCDHCKGKKKCPNNE